MRTVLRQPARKRAAVKSMTRKFASPTAGWVANRNYAENLPGAARVLENWYPESGFVRLRGGLTRTATTDNDVESLFRYNAGVVDKLFAADQANIYDATTPADPTVSLTPVVSGQSSGRYSTQLLTTAGGAFLYALNGVDNPQIFDGTSWTEVTGVSSPALTSASVSINLLSYVFSFKSRLFFIEGNSLSFHYLAVDSIGGALTEFNLSGVLQQGGSLLFGGSWSSDSGSGQDDRFFVVTTRGEVAVYEGSDPSSASTWSLVGLYDLGDPLGQDAHMRAGGDPVIATKEGLIPLSAVIQSDPGALSFSAVSRPIEPEWQREVLLRDGGNWGITKWTDGGYAIVTMPVSVVTESTPAQCFVVNLETGAWAKYTGWNFSCSVVHGGILYGAVGDKIYSCETSGSDGGIGYDGRISLHADDLGMGSEFKIPTVLRGTFLAGSTFTPAFSVAADYDETFSTGPTSSVQSTGGTWDVSSWDGATWGAGSPASVVELWSSVSAPGIAHSPQVQVRSGISEVPSIRLISMDLVFETGGSVV